MSDTTTTFEKPEQVLVIPRSEYEQRGPFQGFLELGERKDLGEYLASLPNKIAFFRPRPDAEGDDGTLQLIPYCALICDGKLLTYTRARCGGEDRLHDKLSIGIGGHINDTDGEEPFWAYHNGVLRELEEEVGLVLGQQDLQNTIVGLLNDDTNPVGRVHLGVAHVFNLRTKEMEKAILDKCEDTLDSPQFIPISDFANPELFDRLESWSQFFVEHLLKPIQDQGKWNDLGFRERMGMMALTLSNAAAAAMGLAMQDNAKGHMLSRIHLEEKIGAVNCMLSGLCANDDINKAALQKEAQAFYDQLPHLLKHQSNEQASDTSS